MPRRELSERDRAVLDFERTWIGQRGGKGDAIRTTFGFTTARYYQVLASLVDDEAALAYDPLLVRRLRRRRRTRGLERTGLTGLADHSGRGVTK